MGREGMICIRIRFGDPEDDEAGETVAYRFGSKLEADAFMEGVAARDGWSEHTVLEDGRYPDDKDAPDCKAPASGDMDEEF